MAMPDPVIAPISELPVFTLAEVHQAARKLLEVHPEAILAYRLLREVLGVSLNDPELIRVKKAVLESKWVQQLEESQLPDGSWGRFHSQDTKKKTMFRTTEEAIDRAFALGLEPSDRVLTRVSRYIPYALHGDAQIADRNEKAESWPLLIKFILTGRLAQTDPTHKLLDSYWTYLAEVATHTFSSGNYRLEDEASAYLRLSGVHVPGGFLESQHALWILSSRKLPYQLDSDLLNWIWQKPDGIRYLRVPLTKPKPYHIGHWLRSMNILSRFGSWRDISIDIVNNLWKQRDKEGMWDFGSEIAQSIDFPLSESWRHRINRKTDYSTCILALLRKCFD